MENPIHQLEKGDCLQLLENNFIGRIGFISNQKPFIVPITYYFDIENNCILSYSAEGNKTNSMRKNTSVSIQVDDVKNIKQWKSLLLFGEYEELEKDEAKKYLQKFVEGVQNTIIKQQASSPKFINDFLFRMSQSEFPIVYKININEISGKFRIS